MVKISAMWVMALACTSDTPKLSITVVAVAPKAMPSAPSTSCASERRRRTTTSFRPTVAPDDPEQVKRMQQYNDRKQT